MRPYLVGSACQQVNIQKRQPVSAFYNAVAGFDSESRVGLFCFKVNAVLLGVLFKKALKRSLLFLGCAVHNCKVALFKLALLYFIAQNSQRLGIFCRYYYSARVSVYAVGKGGAKAVFILWAVFPLFVEIPLYSCYKRIAVFVFIGVDKQALRLIRKQNVFVLINYIKLCRSGHKVIFRLFTHEKFIVYVCLHRIARAKPCVYLRALAVYLYSFKPYIFKHKRLRQLGAVFGYKPIQPLRLIVFGYCKFFHKNSSYNLEKLFFCIIIYILCPIGETVSVG